MSSQPGKAAKRTAPRRQRRYPRYRCEFPVTLTLLSSQGRHSLGGHGRDLSEGGIGILLAEELTQGEVVSLRFSLPGLPQPWDLRAVLRHRRGYYYGFEFLSLTAEQGRALVKFLPSLDRADADCETEEKVARVRSAIIPSDVT
jgi:c-di-GMP-binding flagellar brake protein YcgR